MPRLLQVAPNLASDVRELLKALEGNKKLATFKEALAKFIKPIENLSPQGVAQGIKDSGIMLEAKIAQSLEAQSLPSKIKELLSQMKNTQNQGLKESFLKLPNDSDAKKSISNLETLLKEQKKLNQEIINNSPFKALAKASNDLENAAKYLDKLSNLGKNLSLKTAANLLSHIESSIQNAQKSANNYNLNSATLKDARAIREQINASANELQNALNLLKNKDSNFKAFLTRYDPNNKQNATLKEALSKQNEPKANHIRINIQTSNTGSTAHSSSLNANPAQNSSLSQNSSFSQNASFSQNSTLTQEQNSFKNINLSQFKEATSSEVNTPNLQGKITELARTLTSLKNTLSPELASAKSALEEIKSLARLTKSAAKSIGAIKPNNAEQALKELQSDMKSVLLNLKESTQNQSSTQNIHTAAQRLLTQIEIHQLASFAQNSLQTYLPYHWDELNSSNLSFKRGNKDKFYARIELSFVKFGEIGIVLGLAENKFLDVSIQTGNDGFKELILSETKSLKRALNELGLVVNNFFVASKGGKSAYEHYGDIDLGYNIKA